MLAVVAILFVHLVEQCKYNITYSMVQQSPVYQKDHDQVALDENEELSEGLNQDQGITFFSSRDFIAISKRRMRVSKGSHEPH